MKSRFVLSDIVMLHKIIHNLVPTSLPSYLRFFSGKSRLRFCHLDRLSLVSDLLPNTTACSTRTSNAFANSFFYRTHLLWNNLPLNIREVERPDRFKKLLRNHLFETTCTVPSERDVTQTPFIASHFLHKIATYYLLYRIKHR